MKPISRLRIWLRSRMESCSTVWPLSRYVPQVGESSSPKIESNVDLPQPDGPEMETNSPRRTSKSISLRACVSNSSVWYTLLTCSIRISNSSFPIQSSSKIVQVIMVVELELG